MQTSAEYEYLDYIYMYILLLDSDIFFSIWHVSREGNLTSGMMAHICDNHHLTTSSIAMGTFDLSSP